MSAFTESLIPDQSQQFDSGNINYQPVTPEINPGQSTLSKIADTVLTPLNTLGTVLGAPGSALRGLLAGKGLGSFTSWTSGRDLLDSWGIFPKGEGFDFTGLAADFIDPFLLVGTITGLSASGKLAAAASKGEESLTFLQGQIRTAQKLLETGGATAETGKYLEGLETIHNSLQESVGQAFAKSQGQGLASTVEQQFATGQRGLTAQVPFFKSTQTESLLNTYPLYKAASAASELLGVNKVLDPLKKYFSTAKETDWGELAKKFEGVSQGIALEDMRGRLHEYNDLFKTVSEAHPDWTEDTIKTYAAKVQEFNPERARTVTDTLNSVIDAKIQAETNAVEQIMGKYTETDPRALRKGIQLRETVRTLEDEKVQNILNRDNILNQYQELENIGGPALVKLGTFYDPSMKSALNTSQALGIGVTQSADIFNYAKHILTDQAYDLVSKDPVAKKWFQGSASVLNGTGGFTKERKIVGDLETAEKQAQELFGEQLKTANNGVSVPFYKQDPKIFNESRLMARQVAEHQALTGQHAVMQMYDEFPSFDDWAVQQDRKLTSPEATATAKEEYNAWLETQTAGKRPISNVLANLRLTGTVADKPVLPISIDADGKPFTWVPEEYRTPWQEGKIENKNLISTMRSNKEPILLTKSGDLLTQELETAQKGRVDWGILSGDVDKDAPIIQKHLEAAGLGNRYLDEGIYQDLVKNNQQFTNNQRPFWKYWDSIINLQRTYGIMLSPGYLSTNAITLAWMNMLSGIRASAHVDATKLIANRILEDNPEGVIGRLLSGTVGKDGFAISPDIQKLADEYHLTQAGGKTFFKELIEPETTSLTNNVIANIGPNIDNFNERVFKMAHYISKRQDGLDIIAAGDSVKKYLLDYSDLTTFEKQIPRRLFLGYTWMRKAIPLAITETFLNQRAYFAVQASKESLNSEQFVPDYVKDTGQVYIGNNQFLDLRNPLFDTNRFSPEGQDLARVGQKLLAGTPAQLRIPLEITSGKQFLTGRPLEQAQPNFAGLTSSYVNRQGEEKQVLQYPLLNELISGTPASQMFRTLGEPGKGLGFRVNELQPVETRKRQALIDTIKSQLSEYPEVRTFNDLYSAAQSPSPRVQELMKQLQQANKRTAL